MAMITPRVFNGEGFIFTLWVLKGGSNSGLEQGHFEMPPNHFI
jgi:hypothetical protein